MFSRKCLTTSRIPIRTLSSTTKNHKIILRRKHNRLSGSFLPSSRLLARCVGSCNTFQEVQIRFWSSHQEDLSSHVDDESSKIHDDLLLGENELVHDNKPSTETALESEASISNSKNNHQEIMGISRRQFLIEALANEVTRNVEEIIRQVDRHRRAPIIHEASTSDDSPRGAVEGPSSSQKRNNFADKPLLERWRAALHREKERHRRRHHAKVDGDDDDASRTTLHKMTIDELWIRALEGSGMDVLLGDLTGSEGNDHDSLQLDPMASTIHETFSEGITRTGRGQVVSPIFGLTMDESGRILESEIPVLDINHESYLQSPKRSSQDSTFMSMSKTAHDVSDSDRESELLTDSVLRVKALFVATRKQDWALIRRGYGEDIDISSEEAKRENDKQTPRVHCSDEADYAKNLLDYAREKRVMLTSDENNLLLACLLTSNDISRDEILEKSLQYFNEMSRFPMIGMDASGPNSATYRLLFLGLPRRLDAIGEAARICRSLSESSSVELNSETLVEAMRVCQSYADVDTASRLMTKAMDPKSTGTAGPTVGSCTVFIEMLKDKNMMKEAIDFFDRIHEAKVLRPDFEEELLFQLCRWPNRSRQGDAIDCTSVLLRVMDALFEALEKNRRPQIQLWITLIKRLSDTSKLDPSLEVSINRTFRCILDAYPDVWPGNDLLRIGLRTSAVTNDAGLISELIAREVQRKRGLHEKSSSRIEADAGDSRYLSSIPQMVFQKALEMALQNADAASASSILICLEDVQTDYPLSAKSELYGLVVLCYARASRSREAKELLLSMVEKGMNTSDELFGAVLHSLVVDGKADEARMLFQSMQEDETSLPSPDVSSYNAILVSHIQAREWDQAISFFDVTKDRGVAMNSHTIKGLLLAHVSRDGREAAVAFVENLLVIQAPIDEATFQLAARIILPALGGKDTDDIRSNARRIGEEEPSLRDASVKLIRSARVAEVEVKKLKAKQPDRNGLVKSDSREYWQEALSDLLDLSRKVANTAGKTDL